MNKNLIFILLLGISMMSCNNDYDEVSYDNPQNKQVNDDLQSKEVNNQKFFDEVENFRLAVNKMNRPQYAPTEEYQKRYGDELSDERKQILLEPAKKLILSTGISERELTKETNNDVNQTLNKAFKIYVSKTSKK